MEFLAGLLPGLLLGVLVGFIVTTLVRHGRAIAVTLIKGLLLVGRLLGTVGRGLQAKVDRLVAEARADMERTAGLDKAPAERDPPRGRGQGGGFR